MLESLMSGAGTVADVSLPSQVSPEFREYKRTFTTVVNAYLRPRCRSYLAGLEGLADQVLVMTSAGGLVPTGDAAELPVALLLSGSAGHLKCRRPAHPRGPACATSRLSRGSRGAHGRRHRTPGAPTEKQKSSPRIPLDELVDWNRWEA